MVDVDDEGTLDEEEKFEEKEDHAAEISQLEEEGIICSLDHFYIMLMRASLFSF